MVCKRTNRIAGRPQKTSAMHGGPEQTGTNDTAKDDFEKKETRTAETKTSDDQRSKRGILQRNGETCTN